MHRFHCRVVLTLAVGLLAAVAQGAGPSICGSDGVQDSGSIYRICLPPPGQYNGHLLLFAHGFQDATEPVRIPEEQLDFGEVTLNELVNDLGFAFAVNSYSKTGLAVLQGADDLLDLVEIFAAEHGVPEKVFVAGASEGGIITALLVEQHPEVFAGGLAACGPVGDFEFQIRYFGDARATFEAFFPGLIPGDPFHPSPELVENWRDFYEEVVKPEVFRPDNAGKLSQWVKVARLPFDSASLLETLEQSVRDVLRYPVVNLNDAVETLGGFPFGNRFRWYRGSANDFLLNLRVPRISSDPAAVAEMDAFYDTTGELEVPLITLHTRLDQQVPYGHEVLYLGKTLRSGAFIRRHFNIPVQRYGHCNFTEAEALVSFGLLLFYTGDLDLLAGVGSVLEGDELVAFESLAQEVGLPYRIEGESLQVIQDEEK